MFNGNVMKQTKIPVSRSDCLASQMDSMISQQGSPELFAY
jgi:hypothetical protein